MLSSLPSSTNSMVSQTRLTTPNSEQEMGVKGGAKGEPMAITKSKETERENYSGNFPTTIRSRSSRWQKARLGREPYKENARQTSEIDGVFMCPQFHTKGECWDVGCKYSKTHDPASAVPQNVKTEYMDYMGCWERSSQTPSRESGQGLAVSDHD